MLYRTVKWPEEKQSASMITIELDGEFIWLMMDPTNINRPKTLSMGTYGQLRGLDRMLLSLRERNLKATFFIPGIVAERYPDSVKAVAGDGHEVALHGYDHSNYALLTPEQQREDIRRGIEAIEKVTGKKPVGFRLPEGNMTDETLSIIHEAGFVYDCSLLDDDIPYAVEAEGREPLVEIPMRWELHDFPYFAFNFHPPFPLGECRIANYDEVMDIWLTEQKAYHKLGLCYVIKFDPQSIGTPARISMFDQVLDELTASGTWIATGSEIAGHFRKISF